MGNVLDSITGKPTYNDVSETQSDLQAAVDYAEKAFGESVPTVGDLQADGGIVGRTIFVVAEKCDYVWNGANWARTSGANAIGSITPDADFTLDGTVLELDVQGWVRLSISALRKSGSLVNGETVGTLQSGFWPVANMFRPVSATAAGGEGAQLFIGSDGSLKIYVATTKTAFYGDALYKAA